MTYRVGPLRALADVRLGRQRSPQHDDGPDMVRYLRAANVKDGTLALDDVKTMNFGPAEQQVFALRSGDVLVTEGSGSLAAVGASAVWDGSLDGTICFQNTLLRLRPSPRASGRFLGWWARYAFASGQFAAMAGGANIYHLGAESVRAMQAPLPTLDEQGRVADFLDAETARIDALITAKQRMIDLKADRVSSAMFHAISEGLRSEHRRRSSIAWLKEIPASWGEAPVGAFFRVQLGKMLNAEAANGQEQWPYVKNTNVQWDHIDTASLPTMTFDAADRRSFALEDGDLLVCEGGEVGRAAMWSSRIGEVYYQKALHRVRPIDGANTRYLMYCLWAASNLNVFRVEGNQSTIVHLTAEKLSVHRFPWPSEAQQQEIVAYLDHARAQAQQLTSTLTRQIELLKERRQALITAAVSGELEI